MSEEYYKPTLIQPKDLEIDGTDYNADLNVIKEGNTIKVTMDQDVMIQRVSHEIYSNFESGIRELVNNEYRACRQVMLMVVMRLVSLVWDLLLIPPSPN